MAPGTFRSGNEISFVHPVTTMVTKPRLIRPVHRVPVILFVLVLLFVQPLSGQDSSDSRVMIESRKAGNIIEEAKKRVDQDLMKPAAKIYLEALKKYHQEAVSDEGNRYVGVPELIRRRLSSWKMKWVNWLQDYVRGEAVSKYEKAKEVQDEDLLLKVANIYFFTKPGEQAASDLARRNFRKGNFATAAYWWGQILNYHPEPHKEPLKYRLRLLAAYRLSGNKQKAEQTLERIEKELVELPEEEQSSYRSKLKRITDLPLQKQEITGEQNRDHPGSSPDEENRSDNFPKNEMLLWSFPSTDVSVDFDSDEPFRSSSASKFMNLSGGMSEEFQYSPIYPLVSGDTVLINDGSKLVALDLTWSRLDPEGGENPVKWVSFGASIGQGNREDLNTSSIRSVYKKDLGYLSATVAHGDVYFWMEDQLVRVSKEYGTLKTTWNAPKVDDKELKFNGVPLVYGDFVYVPMVASKVEQETEIFVACFHRLKSKLKWVRSLGVSLNYQGRRRRRSSGGGFGRRFGHLVRSQDSLYLASNMGIVAAMNAVSGDVKWVHDYTPYGDVATNRRDDGWEPEQYSRRGFLPPKIYNDVIYVLPADSPKFLGFQVDTGKKVVSTDAKEAESFVDVRKYEGVLKAILFDYFTKPRGETKFGLREVNLKDPPEDSIFKEARKYDFTNSAEQLCSIRSGDKKYLVGTQNMLNDFLAKDLYLEWTGSWPNKSSLTPFNMTYTEDRLVLAGPGRILTMTGFSRYEKLIADMNQREDVGEALLNHFQLLVQSGRHDKALQKIRQVLKNRDLSMAKKKYKNLEDLFYRLSLGRMVDLASTKEKKTVNWKKIGDVGSRALPLIEDRERAVEIAIRTENAYYRAGQPGDLARIQWKLYREFGDRVISPWRPEGERDSSVKIRVDEYLKMRWESLRKKYPVEFGLRFASRMRSLTPTVLSHRLPGLTDNPYDTIEHATGKSYASEAPGEQRYTPFETLLSLGPETYVKRQSDTLDQVLSTVRRRNRFDVAADLVRILKNRFSDRSFPAGSGTKTGKELAKSLSSWIRTRNSMGSEPLTEPVSLTWNDNPPSFWSSDKKEEEKKNRPVFVNEPDRYDQPEFQFKQIQNRSELRFRFSDVRDGSTSGVLDVMPEVLDSETNLDHLMIKTNWADNGLFKVILNNTESWSASVLLVSPSVRKKPSIHRKYVFQDKLVDSISLTGERMFVSGVDKGDFRVSERKDIIDAAARVNIPLLVEAYTRPGKKLIWSRELPQKARIKWLDATWSNQNKIFFLMENGQANSSHQLKEARNSTNAVERLFSFEQKGKQEKNIMDLPTLSGGGEALKKAGSHLFGVMNMATGAVERVLKLKTPNALLTDRHGSVILSIPLTDNRLLLSKLDTIRGKRTWSTIRNNFSYQPHLSTSGTAVSAQSFQQQEDNPPERLAPGSVSANHSGRGYMITCPFLESPRISKVDVSETLDTSQSSLHVFPTTDPASVTVFVRRPGEKMVYRLGKTGDGSEGAYEIAWGGITNMRRTPPHFDGHEGPGGSFLFWHNFREHPKRWRLYLYDAEEGNLIWTSKTPGEKMNFEKEQDLPYATFPLDRTRKPAFVGAGRGITMQWGNRWFELVSSDQNEKNSGGEK